MSAPRKMMKGATYLVTRRCSQRQFLLRPSAVVNQIVIYCLAYAAARVGIEVHGVVVMSNHWHGVVSDPDARLPQFLQIMHRLIAAAMNALLGRSENFWASGETSVVQLDHPEDVLAKIAYGIVNPVAAGLVEDPRNWPGVITFGFGEALVAEKPAVFFRKKSTMPERVRLVCTLPPALREIGLDAATTRLRILVREGLRRARHAIRSQGRSFLGVDGVLKMPMYRSATTPELLRKRRPTLASLDPARRREALRQVRVFRAAYRVALDRWRAGQRRVRFPEGTYQLRVFHAVTCGPPPLS